MWGHFEDSHLSYWTAPLTLKFNMVFPLKYACKTLKWGQPLLLLCTSLWMYLADPFIPIWLCSWSKWGQTITVMSSIIVLYLVCIDWGAVLNMKFCSTIFHILKDLGAIVFKLWGFLFFLPNSHGHLWVMLKRWTVSLEERPIKTNKSKFA